MKDKSKVIAYGILRALGIIAGIVFILWFLYKIQAVLVYLGQNLEVKYLKFSSIQDFLRRNFILKIGNKIILH